MRAFCLERHCDLFHKVESLRRDARRARNVVSSTNISISIFPRGPTYSKFSANARIGGDAPRSRSLIGLPGSNYAAVIFAQIVPPR